MAIAGPDRSSIPPLPPTNATPPAREISRDREREAERRRRQRKRREEKDAEKPDSDAEDPERPKGRRINIRA